MEGVHFIYGKTTKSCKKRTRDDGSSRPITDEADIESTSSSNVPIVESNVGAFEDADNFIEKDVDWEQLLWKKRSIFFELPYWEYNLLRHNLDVMHIEKNVCDNLLGTLLNLDGKTKENEKARRELMEMGIRHDLHLVEVLIRSLTRHLHATLCLMQ